MQYTTHHGPSSGLPVRIGEVAARTGLTPRTIRYYEEIGLLPGGAGRAKGRHRLYDALDIERLSLIVRLRDLLGLPLEEIQGLVTADGEWLLPNRPWTETESMVERMKLIDAALGQIERQLSLVRLRREALADLEQELLHRSQAIETRRLTGA